MESEPESTESGQPIYRHSERTKPFEPAIGDQETIQGIARHIETHIGEVDHVFHELISDLVHIDVHIVNPTKKRDFFTLITSGMSDRPMTVPDGAREFRYAELLICLPPSWLFGAEAWKDESNYWPVRLLKQLARMPHEYETWLGLGHSMPNGDPPQPYAPNTKLCCALLFLPSTTPDDFDRLQLSPAKTVQFYGVYPLYKEEMALKLRKGADALISRFAENRITEVLDVSRRNVAKRSFWPF